MLTNELMDKFEKAHKSARKEWIKQHPILWLCQWAIMIGLPLILLIGLFAGCSHAPEITKWTSPDLRVAVDPQGIDSANYVRLEEALVKTRKFFVIDRGSGFKAITKEQDYVHGVSYGAVYQPNTFERYGDSDRYARLGRLYSVGSIVVAQTRCGTKIGFWGAYKHCEQYLALVNSTTGEVVAAVSGIANDAEDYYGEMNVAASWDNTVEKLVDAIPENYEPSKYNERMRLYRKEIREDSIRERETKANEPSGLVGSH